MLRRAVVALGQRAQTRAAATALPKWRWQRRPAYFLTGLTVGACAGGAAFTVVSAHPAAPVVPPFDLDGVKRDIEDIISDNIALGPRFVRLAWHAAGGWDARRKDGSPNTAAMRFEPECAYGANKGLADARVALEGVKKKHPTISYADLWTLAAVVAIENMGGPDIPWRWGRVDAKDGTACAPDGRLPDGALTQDHIRHVFSRLGFNDEETVALIGAHTCGECAIANSGFTGPWTHDKYGFDNSFFVELFDNNWELNTEAPNVQFRDSATKNLMMLPADIALIVDPSFKSISRRFADDNDLFCAKFSAAFQKLLELGPHRLHDVPS